MKLAFKEHFLDNIEHKEDVFNYCMSIRGEIVKSSPARTVSRFIHRQHPYFIKIHTGVGWYEIFKNVSQGKKPVLGAKDEWQAIERLRQLGLSTLVPVGYGVRGNNPARQESFIITNELQDTVSLEVLTAHWSSVCPNVLMKRALIKKLARVMKVMHEGGVNHRDCYLCHFHLHLQGGVSALRLDALALTVLDLHRAQVRCKVPRRWQVKDLAGLYFSSKNIGLTRSDYGRFVVEYTGMRLRDNWQAQAALWRCVIKTGEALYRRSGMKSAP